MRAEQLHAFFVRGHHVARHHPIIPREDGVHPAVRRIADVADRGFAELIVPLSVRQAFANIGTQSPCSEHRAIGRRLAGLYGCQDFFIGRQVVLPEFRDYS